MAYRKRCSAQDAIATVRAPENQAIVVDTKEGEGEMASESSEECRERYFALSRCRYKSNAALVTRSDGKRVVEGDTITAEPGDEIVNPYQSDLQDLIEHGAVESFEPGQVSALLALKRKDSEAKKRLARMLGVI